MSRLFMVFWLLVMALHQAPALAGTPASQLRLSYTDRVTVAARGFVGPTIWYPDRPGGGDALTLSLAVTSFGEQPPSGVILASSFNDELRRPQNYTVVHEFRDLEYRRDNSILAPVQPLGYRCLGMTVGLGPTDRPPPNLTCVREDLTVPAAVGESLGALGFSPFTGPDAVLWDIECPAGAIDVGGFVAAEGGAKPSGPVYCLAGDAPFEPLGPPSNVELGSLLFEYGPIIRFHEDELYFPDDPAALLEHSATQITWSQVFNEDDFDDFSETVTGNTGAGANTVLDDVQAVLNSPGANTDPFTEELLAPFGGRFKHYINYPKSLQGGNLDRAKAYVRVQPLNEVLTELQFWIFYPWNGPGRAEAGCGDVEVHIDPTAEVGAHYSDWENIRVRVTNKNVWNQGVYSLVDVVISRHSTEETVRAADPRLERSQTNPVIYAGRDSHAHYLSAGFHKYERAISLDVAACTAYVDLYDLTGNAKELHTWGADKYLVVSSAWPEIPTTRPDWLFYGGQWGGFEPHEFRIELELPDPLPDIDFGRAFAEVSTGKPGLIRRNEWAVSCPRNADLGSLRVSAGTMTPAFSPEVTNYRIERGNNEMALSLTPQAVDHQAEIEYRINGGGYTLLDDNFGRQLGKATDEINLDAFENTIEVRVTVQGCAGPVEKTYTLTVAPSADARRVSISDHVRHEGDSGTVEFFFDVTLSKPSPIADVCVDYEVRPTLGNATPDVDFVVSSGLLCFPEDEIRQLIFVEVIGDTDVEDDELFVVELSNPDRAVLDDRFGVGRILNDDPNLTFETSFVEGNEGDTGTTSFDFTVRLSQTSASEVSVDFSTRLSLTAQPDVDYEMTSRRLVFAPGQTLMTASVAVYGDELAESTEAFQVELSNPVNAVIPNTGGVGLGQILDDDPAVVGLPALIIQDRSQLEGDTGTSSLQFRANLLEVSTAEVTFDWTTEDDSATGGEDFVAASGSASIPAGETSAAFAVTINGDRSLEEDEQFIVRLSNAANAFILDGVAAGIIETDDLDLLDVVFSSNFEAGDDGAP